jgi:hypothetical protein
MIGGMSEAGKPQCSAPGTKAIGQGTRGRVDWD